MRCETGDEQRRLRVLGLPQRLFGALEHDLMIRCRSRMAAGSGSERQRACESKRAAAAEKKKKKKRRRREEEVC